MEDELAGGQTVLLRLVYRKVWESCSPSSALESKPERSQGYLGKICGGNTLGFKFSTLRVKMIIHGAEGPIVGSLKHVHTKEEADAQIARLLYPGAPEQGREQS